MDHALTLASSIIAIILIIGMVIYLQRKASSSAKDILPVEALASIASGRVVADRVQGGVIAIPIEQLPATIEIEEKSLFEITDRTVIARISQTFPAIAETATRTMANNALGKMEVYKAILPGGETLARSRDMEGAVRGFYHGTKGITGHANLVEVDVSETTALASGVANVVNVGSLVVGQYYMSQISSKLTAMTKTIDKISDFQDREFKSRALSVITLVGEISRFRSEIIEDDEQRRRKLSALDIYKATTIELLGQVNISICDTTRKNTAHYEAYQANVDDLRILIEYQNLLVAVLRELSKLTYVLEKGTISAEMSYAVFDEYHERSVQTRNLLRQWHNRQIKALDIDLDEERIPKDGFGRAISWIPGLLDAKYRYRSLPKGFAQEVSMQAKPLPDSLAVPRQVHGEDIDIIIKDGKYFYWHEPSEME